MFSGYIQIPVPLLPRHPALQAMGPAERHRGVAIPAARRQVPQQPLPRLRGQVMDLR